MPDIRDAFPSKYLKASDLKGRSIVVYIDRIDYEPVGQSREMKPVVYFRGKEKGLVLNKTNCNKIISITASPVTEDWEGHPIVIYPTETSFQGDQVECIRVKQAAPSFKRVEPEPEPEPTSEPEPVGAGITDDDIPFAWLVPFATGLLGSLSWLA